MPLSEEDQKLWSDFKNKCEKSINFDGRIVTDRGKNLLRTIKNTLKTKEEFNHIYDDFADDSNFSLEKDKTLGIDRKSDKKLASGKYLIDASLDLHGLTLEAAYHKTKYFFERAVQNNYRCILIITGKGLHSGENNIKPFNTFTSLTTSANRYRFSEKTIKESIVDWLREPFFSTRIIKYTDAHKIHGGNGAIYVLLKK